MGLQLANDFQPAPNRSRKGQPGLGFSVERRRTRVLGMCLICMLSPSLQGDRRHFGSRNTPPSQHHEIPAEKNRHVPVPHLHLAVLGVRYLPVAASSSTWHSSALHWFGESWYFTEQAYWVCKLPNLHLR